MQFYRLKWPEASVTPRLHMLEHHAIPFLKKWGAGFRFYREQGGESIHMEFNKLKTIYIIYIQRVQKVSDTKEKQKKKKGCIIILFQLLQTL